MRVNTEHLKKYTLKLKKKKNNCKQPLKTRYFKKMKNKRAIYN